MEVAKLVADNGCLVVVLVLIVGAVAVDVIHAMRSGR